MELLDKLERDQNNFRKNWLEVFKMEHDESTSAELEKMKEKAMKALEEASLRIGEALSDDPPDDPPNDPPPTM